MIHHIISISLQHSCSTRYSYSTKLRLRHLHYQNLQTDVNHHTVIKLWDNDSRNFIARNTSRKLRESAIDEKKSTVSRRSYRSIEFLLSSKSSFFISVFSFFLAPLYHGIVLDQSLAKMRYDVIVIIHHYTKWLPDDETCPYDDVAPSGAAVSFRHLAQHRQWYLEWTISVARPEFPYLGTDRVDLVRAYKR